MFLFLIVGLQSSRSKEDSSKSTILSDSNNALNLAKDDCARHLFMDPLAIKPSVCDSVLVKRPNTFVASVCSGDDTTLENQINKVE